MRLLVLGDALAPHTRRWAKWFADRGHEVHVATFNSEVLPGYEPAAVHVLWDSASEGRKGRLRRMAIVQRRLGRLAKELKPDVVHAHSVGGYAWAANWLRFQPMVLSPWGTDILVDIRESRMNRVLTQSALRRSPLVLTDGWHFVDLLADLGVDRRNIQVLAFGTDTKRFSPSDDDVALRQEMGLGADPVIISTRTPNPVHDVATFIQAAPLILESEPRARFIVVGDGTERASLEDLARQLGVAARFTFTGMVEEARMRDLLALSDVYVSTSLMDAGLAGSTAEAMSMALPVVHTDNSDNSYWAPDGVGGFLFSNGDYERLADSVASLLANDDARAAMGARNRERVVDEYDTDTQLRTMEGLYESLLEASCRAG